MVNCGGSPCMDLGSMACKGSGGRISLAPHIFAGQRLSEPLRLAWSGWLVTGRVEKRVGRRLAAQVPLRDGRAIDANLEIWGEAGNLEHLGGVRTLIGTVRHRSSRMRVERWTAPTTERDTGWQGFARLPAPDRRLGAAGQSGSPAVASGQNHNSVSPGAVADAGCPGSCRIGRYGLLLRQRVRRVAARPPQGHCH